MTYKMRQILFTATALSLLSGCGSMPSFERSAQQSNIGDDDAYCQSKGYAAGSPDYVSCRKERDGAMARENRVERAHRGLADDMLNSQSAKGPWSQ